MVLNSLALSIVVEWENARLSEAERSLRMLAELARQLDAERARGSRRVEILVLHNPEAVEAGAIAALVDRVRPRAAWPAQVRLIASGGRGYYQQKNFGVTQASGDLVLFVDSDVVPEPGWLERLLAAFDDPGSSVVCGSTYVELGSWYERAMAAFWLFPLRSARDGLEEAEAFHANNVAFRREVIAANPFPDLPTFRGQCGVLCASLRARGVRIRRHAGARVSHPPPNGLRHFVNRAMTEGHDDALRDRLAGRKAVKSGFKDFTRRMRRATGRIAAGRREAGLSVPGAAGAWGLALGYHGCKLAGRLLTAADPAIVRRRFPI